MEFRLQTLSPVHIGSGRNVEPFEYVVDRGQYFRVDLDAFMERAYDQDPEAPDKLSAWITGTAEQIEDLRREAGRAGSRDYNQQLSDLRRKFNLLAFCQSRPEYRGLADLLLAGDGFSRYRCRTNASDRHLLKEQIKTADFQPFIPGSSVKGAIRTALAHLILTEMGPEEKQQIRDGVPGTDIRGLSHFLGRVEQARNGRERARLKEDAGTDLETLLFMGGVRKGNQILHKDIHYDLMKIISVSDTYYPEARFIVPQVHTFLKKRTREGTTFLDAQVPILMEALSDNSSFSIRIEVDTAFLKRARGIPTQEKWVGLPEKVRRVFGLSLDEMERMPEEEIERRIVGRIREACRMHSGAVVAEELRWAGRFRPEEVTRISRFYQDFRSLPEDITPLRLGWGSHFMTTTLLLALRDDEILGSSLEQLVRVFELDLTLQQRRLIQDLEARRINMDEFPRSRRMVSVNRTAASPLGWIALGLPDAPPAPRVVDVEALLAEQREASQQRGRTPTGRQEMPSGGRSRGPQQARFDAPPRRAEPLPKLPAPSPVRTEQTPGKLQKGDKVPAEVLSNEGGIVRVRMTGASGEEVSFRAYYPHKAGAKVKVRIESMDANGKITKVAP